MNLERLLTVPAFLMLCAFLGVLIWKLQRLDLGCVLAATLLLASYDLFVHRRRAR